MISDSIFQIRKIAFVPVLLLMVANSLSLIGQELNINVTVNAPRVKNIDPKVFETFESELTRFFNNTKWTEDEFEDFEKIEGNISINVIEDNANSFSADIQVQGVRPVFNSTYKTQTLNYQDKGVQIIYNELQPIRNSFNSYFDPLSSLMTFYAFMIIGFDYDTFEIYGGDEHFKTAKSIINNLPQGAVERTGWDPNLRSNISRVNVTDEILSPRMRPYRQAIYEYHMKSLDQMTSNALKSRAVMMSAITSIGEVNSSVFDSGIIQMFSDTKRVEIIEIFKAAPRGDKSKVHAIMVKVDPARASEYDPIN